MKTKEITVYSLNPDVYKWREFYIQELRDMNIFKSVERIAFNYTYRERLRTILMAHIYSFIHALDAGAFPVLFLEDDARIRKPLPEEFNIPEECDIVYLGGSRYNPGIIPNMYTQEYNDEFYRVYYMLSAHAILVKNERGCRLMMDAYTDAIFKRMFNDVCLALLSKNNVFLTPKKGLYFYQDYESRGVTDFNW
jgi:hypothetical protein